jgi:hypothetical protein
MYVQWQGMQIVETRRAGIATRNAGDNVAKYQEPSVSDVGLQIVQEMQ